MEIHYGVVMLLDGEVIHFVGFEEVPDDQNAYMASAEMWNMSGLEEEDLPRVEWRRATDDEVDFFRQTAAGLEEVDRDDN